MWWGSEPCSHHFLAVRFGDNHMVSSSINWDGCRFHKKGEVFLVSRRFGWGYSGVLGWNVLEGYCLVLQGCWVSGSWRQTLCPPPRNFGATGQGQKCQRENPVKRHLFSFGRLQWSFHFSVKFSGSSIYLGKAEGAASCLEVGLGLEQKQLPQLRCLKLRTDTLLPLHMGSPGQGAKRRAGLICIRLSQDWCTDRWLLGQWFSTGRGFIPPPPPNIWQCLETIFAVVTAGKGATGVQCVEAGLLPDVLPCTGGPRNRDHLAQGIHSAWLEKPWYTALLLRGARE